METFTELRHLFIYMLTTMLWLTTTAKLSYAVENCTQWDKWVNLHAPSQTGHGDSGPIAEVKRNSALCGAHPTKIECLTAGGDTADNMGQIVTCDLWHGLECDNMNQFDLSGCLDYKVRLACLKLMPECVNSGKITTLQSTLNKSPSACYSGWSAWINEDTPDSGDGDQETMTAAQKLKFCPGGMITEVECATKDGMPYASTGEISTCYKDTGFTCNTMDNFDIPCQDYKIRYNCKCSAETWKMVLLTVAALIAFGLCCCMIFCIYVKYIKRNGKRKIEDIDGNSKTPEDCT